MLTVAPSAAEAIATLVSSNGLPAEAGVRLSAAPSTNTEGGVGVQIALTDGPAPDDQVIDEGDAHVFVDPDVAPVLDESTLQATAQDNRIAFALA